MLTKEQIQFTDRYLEKSGIKYMDIRHEMTDHVATALENREGDFYENFRQYMVQHKQSLMQSNRYFKKMALRRAFGILKSNVIKPAFWIMALVIFTIGYITGNLTATYDMITYLEIFSVIISSVVYLYFIYYWMFKKQVHSVLMRLLLIMYLANMLGFSKVIHNVNFLMAYHALHISFYILLIQSVWQLNQQYRLKYND